ncbi:MAG TPA: tRNA uridine-5-carboxymethylaminomethyl(34) synthesis GTPase MnmE, partial [Bacteroidetes bacterium]|nr:tRNA uridine-5-carboxymethylaminomethyl(34) synthesis GTPase MnmE [Bacteroidota bacterium]
MTNNEDTIVALATPSGAGAIGVIRLSGPDAIHIANRVFKGKDLTKQATHTLHYGAITDGEFILDEVVVALFVGPKSYTRENVVEISCHGSNYIIESVIKLLIKKGARAAKAGEFTLRAFLNGQLDLSQAEAVADLIASNSKASQQVALQQLRGGFSNQLAQLREQLVQFASLIELELDFAEEDVEFANRDQLKQLIHTIIRIISSLIQSFELGNAIKNGVNTV